MMGPATRSFATVHNFDRTMVVRRRLELRSVVPKNLRVLEKTQHDAFDCPVTNT